MMHVAQDTPREQAALGRAWRELATGARPELRPSRRRARVAAEYFEGLDAVLAYYAMPGLRWPMHYMQTLLAASQGGRHLSACDEMIAERCKVSVKTVARWREDLIAVEKAAGVSLVICSPGDQRRGENVPTAYEFPVSELLARAMVIARRDSRYGRGPQRRREAWLAAIPEAAPEVDGLDEFPRRGSPKKRPSTAEKAERRRKAVVTQTVSLWRSAAGISDSDRDGALFACFTEVWDATHPEGPGLAAWVAEHHARERVHACLEEASTHQGPADETPEGQSTGGGVDAPADSVPGGQNVRPSPPQPPPAQDVSISKSAQNGTFAPDKLRPDPSVRRQIELRERTEATGGALACCSVGVGRFEASEKLDALGAVVDHREIGAEDFLRAAPHLVGRANERGRSLIVRPRGPGLVQLDDLDAEKLARVEQFAFMTIETSPANFQAWLSVSDGDTHPNLRRRLIAGAGADPGASGAARWPGSRNFKPGRGGFQVRVLADRHGRRCTVAELEAAGLLAPPDPEPSAPLPPVHSASSPRAWGEYYASQDRSRADFRYSCDGLRAGFSVEEIAARLVTLEGSKAKERGLKYALTTARKAAREVGGA